MTQEEKAKAYDEALERARSMYESRDDAELAAFIFPQLAESEDERIRENIISWLKNIEGQTIPINEYNSALAWLEKPKEQKPGLEKANDLRTWLNIVSKVLTEFQGIGQYLDNPICQETANMLREKYCFDDVSSDWDRVYRKGLDAGERYGYNKAKKEQKPAEWSEEDTEMYINVASSLRGYACGLENEEHKKHIKKELDWLENRFKSLRPQQKPVEWSDNFEEAVADLIEKAKQGKCDSLSAIEEANKLFAIAKHGKVNLQEWSEEDEAMRKNILWVLESFISKAECESCPSLITSYPTYYKEIDWLKSLRPSWKPSEEQMAALLNIEGDLRAFQHNDKAKIIAELYEQLKRIKED